MDWEEKFIGIIIKGDLNGQEISEQWINVNNAIAITRSLLEKQEEENNKLREFLWLRHGCPIESLYGDDGELHCGKCMIDFKRMSIEQIQEIWHREGLQKLKDINAIEPEGE